MSSIYNQIFVSLEKKYPNSKNVVVINYHCMYSCFPNKIYVSYLCTFKKCFLELAFNTAFPGHIITNAFQQVQWKAGLSNSGRNHSKMNAEAK